MKRIHKALAVLVVSILLTIMLPQLVSGEQPPARPSNSSPLNGAPGVSLTPTLQSSAFSDPDAGDSHSASQWRITDTSGDYVSPVFDSLTHTSHLTSLTIPSGTLTYGTTYYWMVRHSDSSGAWSEWSQETYFTTVNLEYTEVLGGTIATDTFWDKARSPYIVKCNLLVQQGITLTIEPGVEVKFDSGFAMQTDGTLVARGTSDNRILFTSRSDSPSPGDWGFIKFSPSSTDATFDENGNYSSGSIFQYCQISYSGGGPTPSLPYGTQSPTAAIQIESSSPFIDNCIISHNKGVGMYANTPSNVRISNSTISDSARFGSPYDTNRGGITLNGGSATITGNAFTNNTAHQRGGGITILSNNAPTLINNNTITNNTATGNDYGVGGVLVTGNTATVTISNNTISNNSGSSGYGGGGGGIKVMSNNAEVIIDNNTISDNNSGAGGGGIDLGRQGFGATGSATITNNTITRNTPDGIQALGGGGFGPTTITDYTVTSNQSCGISVNGGAFTIQDNTVTSNSAGINVGGWSGNNANSISGNTVTSNTNGGLCISGTSQNGTIQGNVVTENGGNWAIYLSNDSWTVNNNSIHDNNTTYDLYYDGSSNTTLNATNNWWGTTDVTQIRKQDMGPC